MADQDSPSVGTTLTAPFYILDSSGARIKIIDASGNLVASVTVSATDLTATGNTSLGDAVTDTLTVKGATTIMTTAAVGFAVGAAAAGANPAFQVDASTASQAAGLKVTGAIAAGTVAVAVISSGAAANLSLDAKGTGTISIGSVSTGAITLARATGVTGDLTVTSAGASALAVGPNGATNPALVVDASTASSATGLQVKSAAAAGGLALSVVSSGNDESLTIDAKGAGTITLGTTSTGKIAVKRQLEVTATTGIVSTVATVIAPFIAAAVSDTPAPTAAIPLTNYLSKLDSTAGATTQTLAASTVIGQLKKIQMIVDGGDDVVTVTSLLGGTTITFADVGDFAILMWNGTNWVPIELGNDADGVTAPVLA